MKLHELGAGAAVRSMQAAEISPTEMVKGILDRLDATEPDVRAWETIDAEGALAQARALEASADRQRLLYGLPLGIKDVIHVRGLPTGASFEPFRDRQAQEDAGLVQCLREAGAIILGKTVTTQFAWSQDPPKTRNPRNLAHTPGGSSSGSAATVGAWQVPAAIGTQTTGSLLRPSGYCGAVALKPSFGRVSCYGVLPTSWSSDHPGIVVRSVADAGLVLQAIGRHDPRDPSSANTGPEDFVGAASAPGSPPRLGVVRDLLDRAQPEVRAAATRAIETLDRAGATLEEITLPIPMQNILAIHGVVHNSEGAAIHAEQYAKLSEHYRPSISAHIEVSQLLPAALYVQALRLRRRTRKLVVSLLSRFDAFVAPTAPDLPPRIDAGLKHRPLGDPSFQAIWTCYGLPNITLPTGLIQTETGLPHAIQLVGRPLDEQSLLRTAAWCEPIFEKLPAPF